MTDRIVCLFVDEGTVTNLTIRMPGAEVFHMLVQGLLGCEVSI